MTTGNDAAYPSHFLPEQYNPEFGLTKRELFAAMAMQGVMADPNTTLPFSRAAYLAVQAADALIEALDDDKDDSEGGNVASDRGPIQ